MESVATLAGSGRCFRGFDRGGKPHSLGALYYRLSERPWGPGYDQAVFVDPFKGYPVPVHVGDGFAGCAAAAEVRQVGFFLVAFAVCMPVLYGLFGVLAGGAVRLSIAGATLLGVLAASASYIAAPAAMRISLPKRIPSYLTASLGITFPFNLAFGIPLYFWFSTSLWGV